MESPLIDSEVAAMMLNITTNHLRQLVYRGFIKPVQKVKRVNYFLLQDVTVLAGERLKRVNE